jgi:hypothetical protein
MFKIFTVEERKANAICLNLETIRAHSTKEHHADYGHRLVNLECPFHPVSEGIGGDKSRSRLKLTGKRRPP